MNWFLVVISWIAAISSSAPSSGCGETNTVTLGEVVDSSFTVTSDPNFVDKSRDYSIYIPSTYDESISVPLVLGFHGQYGQANGYLDDSDFITMSEEQGFIVVFLQGEDDGNCGTGWNVLDNDTDITDTCNTDADAWACCYDSCLEIGACTGDGMNAGCRWNSCYDEVAFMSDLYDSLVASLCIDTDLVYGTGWSNGGMLSHWIYSRMPGFFTGLAPIYGLPLAGQINVPVANNITSVIHIHGRTDTVIPADGGWAMGWEYESVDSVYAEWATVKGCDSSRTVIETPYDGGADNIECSEYLNCNSGRLVVCLYDGGHVSIEAETSMTFWFFGMNNISSWTSDSTTSISEGCDDMPGWDDGYGNGCSDYVNNGWCTEDGQTGTGWYDSYSYVTYYTYQGANAFQACCGCGGGNMESAAVQPSLSFLVFLSFVCVYVLELLN